MKIKVQLTSKTRVEIIKLLEVEVSEETIRVNDGLNKAAEYLSGLNSEDLLTYGGYGYGGPPYVHERKNKLDKLLKDFNDVGDVAEVYLSGEEYALIKEVFKDE